MKFLKSDELEVGKFYQEYNEDKEPYSIVTNLKIEVTYWGFVYRIDSYRHMDYLYVEISAHSFNRLKRHVLAKLDC